MLLPSAYKINAAAMDLGGSWLWGFAACSSLREAKNELPGLLQVLGTSIAAQNLPDLCFVLLCCSGAFLGFFKGCSQVVSFFNGVHQSWERTLEAPGQLPCSSRLP